MTARTIFLDVDGTLIGHDQHLAPSAIAAVGDARRRGHLVFLSTGRSRSEIPDEVLAIGFDGVISAGGGFTERHGVLVDSRLLTARDVEEIQSFLSSRGIEYIMQGYDAIHPSRGAAERLSSALASGRVGSERDGADDDELLARLSYRGAAPTEGIAKVTFLGDHPRTFATVRDGLGDGFHVITGTIPYLGEAGGEVSRRGVDKGAAIERLLAAEGLSLDDAVAIGDSANDLEMLEIVGLGIAMGNADAAVKAVADEITRPVSQDGVWHALRSHGLI
ncbi:Cof-type HAD-IIB family hydrolase [Labedella phragmitis]|uniref:Cof-type HAD-IIB family hydrolase n=1 Tax=Labedella phragmitis TaxID=2498849 RepID=A0A3S4A3R6_9MICO|nr:Cof-type HAD-IIB family hydrolase [Labedella phragmitis]RWZ50833.1 Cof-type HAD-IIB family hydrolase [Labedella phragmitis]